MSPKSRGRPPGRGRAGKARQKRIVRQPRVSDVMLQRTKDLEGDVDALFAEQWASEWLGTAWVTAPMGERHPERALCTEVVGRACSRPSAGGLAAVAALLRVAPEGERSMLEEAMQILVESQPVPAWFEEPGATPVAASRAVDVWDSSRVLFVEYASPIPHTLAAWIMTAGGTFVTALAVLGPGAAATWAAELDQPTPMPLTEAPASEVLAELAEALRRTDMTWPRNDEDEFVKWRALAWTRCRGHAGEPPEWEPLPDEQRQQLVDDFVTTGVPDDDVTRSVADLFLDYGDGYIQAGPLAWSPTEVQLLLADWLPRKAALDAEQRAALPGLLKRWVAFVLGRRALQPEWIEPVVAAVDEYVDEFERAFDDESSWGPAKQIASDLQARGVDMSDPTAVDEGMRALNAERLAQRLRED